MKILLIEDNDIAARATYRVLRRMIPGCEVLTVESAPAAIEAMTQHADVDAVVSDHDLVGKLTGLDVLLWVHVNRPALVERFVFLSSHDDLGRHHPKCVVKASEDTAGQLARYLGVAPC